MIELSNKVAIVSGGASGIGRGISEVLSTHGASVAVVDIDRKGAESVASNLMGNGQALGVFVDVTDQASVQTMVSAVIQRYGRVDILVNNAGVIGADGWWDRKIPNDKDWDHVHSVNLRGVVNLSKAVASQMIPRNYGKIINIASIAGRQGSPDLPHYSASKAAVISWTQSSALQLAPHNINVNAVCPGLIWTPIWEAIAKKRERFPLPNVDAGTLSGRELFERIVHEWIPMKREQTPKDIGALAAFLASEAAHNITGQAINVDGGLRMN